MTRSAGLRVALICATLLLVIQVAIVPGVLPSDVAHRWAMLTQAQASLTFQPANVSLAVGADTWIDIRINNVTNLYAVDVRLTYGSAIIEVLDGSATRPGINLQPGTFPKPEIIIKNDVNNALRDIWYVVGQQSPTPAVSGSGVLARIHIRGVASGNTTISFVGHAFSSPEGYPIASTAGVCNIQVGDVSTSTPTSGPTQTGTPGPSPTATATSTGAATITPTTTGTVQPTSTATPSPTAALRTFTGRVFDGPLGNRSTPLSGARVQLWGTWTPGTHGFHINSAVTGFDGVFAVSMLASYPHYSLILEVPAGYVPAGVVPGTGGARISDTWVQFLNTIQKTYPGTDFFVVRGTPGTTTPTATPDGGDGTPTPTVRPTGWPVGPIYATYKVEKDTYLDSENPDRNYGKDGHLHHGFDRTGVTKNSLLWFNLADIPCGAAIQEATLFIFGRNMDSTVRLCAHGMKRYWEELGATWRQARALDLWGQNGALDLVLDSDPECMEGIFTDAGGAQYYEFDVRMLVQQWVNCERENEGFMVRIPPESRAKYRHGLYSGDYQEQNLHPALSILYSVSPPATATPTATATATPTTTPTVTPTATVTPSTGEAVFVPCILKQ